MLTTIRTRLVLGALLALFLPLAAGAQVSDPIQQEINALLAEIAALQQQLATLSITPAPAPTPVPSPAPAAPRVRCPSLYRDLSLGASGADIVALQSFLADEGFFHANATGFFGPITEASVQAWQSAQGVVRSGAPATGRRRAPHARRDIEPLRRLGEPARAGSRLDDADFVPPRAAADHGL